MKRYVKEFANDMLKRERECISPLNEKEQMYRIERIEKYVAACEIGLITDYETVKAIIDFLEMWYTPGRETE